MTICVGAVAVRLLVVLAVVVIVSKCYQPFGGSMFGHNCILPDYHHYRYDIHQSTAALTPTTMNEQDVPCVVIWLIGLAVFIMLVTELIQHEK